MNTIMEMQVYLLNGNGTVENLIISGNIVSTGDNVGSICSSSTIRMKITNCISYVNIQATGNNVGGITGNYGTVTNCQNYGEIYGEENVGGIVGYSGIITNCRNYEQVSGTSFVGGISGAQSSLIKDCENYGEIIASNNVGGISGYNSKIINKCINYTKINGINNVGGITGSANSVINCINNGEVESSGSDVGGIIGSSPSGKVIINRYNSATTQGNENVGGIMGHAAYTQNNMSKIINCYEIGEISGTSNIGGILGRKDGYGTNYIEYCYWPEEFNLNAANIKAGSLLEINKSQAYSLKHIRTEVFLKSLNDYVDSYNSGNKEYTDSEELLHWEMDTETGYPTLDF